MTEYALQKLTPIPGVTVIGPPSAVDRGPVISFVVDKIHPHDVSELLNTKNIAVRGGHHCAMPLHSKIGLTGTSRISFQIYNTKQEIDKVVEELRKVQEVFRR